MVGVNILAFASVRGNHQPSYVGDGVCSAKKNIYIYIFIYIYLLNKDQNPATAGSARINAKEREKNHRTGRPQKGINARKGGSLIVIVCWEAVVHTIQGVGRKKRNENVSMRRRHYVTQWGMPQVKVSEEEKWRGKLQNQKN